MKKIFLVFSLLFFAAVAQLPAMSKKKKTQPKLPYSGTVMNFPKGSKTFVIVPDDQSGKRFFADNLAEQYKKDGMKVEFIGTETQPAPNVRMMGTPLHLKLIQEKK